MVKKNPACRILRLRRVAPATCSPPPQCDNCFFTIRIRVSKGLSGGGVWQMAQKNIGQVTFVRWRGDSKIVETNAEYDFRLKRLIEMLRTMERAQIFCAICQTPPPDRPFDTRIP